MLRPTVTKVVPLNNYRLFLEYDDGENGIFDVTPYIRGSWYSKLREPSYFLKVKLNGISIEWPDGQDISPDDLYFLAKKNS